MKLFWNQKCRSLYWVGSCTAGIAAIVILISSCASNPPSGKPTGLTAARFFQLQRDRVRAFQRVSGKVSLRYEGTEESISGKGRYLAGDKGNYRLEIRDPLGRVHYLAALSQNSFQAQYPRQNRAYVDEQGGRQYLRKLARVALDFHGLVDLSTGIIPAVWSKGNFDSWEWDEANSVYRGEAKVRSAVVEVGVAPDTGAIVALTVKEPDTVLEVRYSELEPCCSGFEMQQTLARVAELHWPKSKALFEFEWNDLKSLEGEPKKLSFTPELNSHWKIVRF